MATGTGKTVVMAIVIAWQILNKVSYPQDPRFAKNVLVVAPGLTIKSRLAVLDWKTPYSSASVSALPRGSASFNSAAKAERSAAASRKRRPAPPHSGSSSRLLNR